MPIIRKPSTAARASVKKAEVKHVIQARREPALIKEMSDTSFGTLDASSDGLLVSYDSATNKFVLATADDILSASVDDFDLPDDFVDRLEEELVIPVTELDAGGF